MFVADKTDDYLWSVYESSKYRIKLLINRTMFSNVSWDSINRVIWKVIPSFIFSEILISIEISTATEIDVINDRC